MGGSPVVTRPLERIEEFRDAEELQRRVWGFVDVEVVPLHTLLAGSKNGGLALGAFLRDDAGAEELVGLGFGFAGRDALGPKLHSHIVGVAPNVRNRGVGAALKWHQRRAVRAEGVPRVTWTYDPLMAGNARFNLDRLGAVAERYEVNVYGEIRDELNRGLPTDRLVVDWWLDDPGVVARAEGRPPAVSDDATTLPEATRSSSAKQGGWRVPEGWERLDAPRLRLEIPADLQSLKRDDPEAALAWRMLIREAMRTLFADGYRAVAAYARRGRAFYVLARRGRDREPATPS